MSVDDGLAVQDHLGAAGPDLSVSPHARKASGIANIACSVSFQIAEFTIPRNLLADVLVLIKEF
jgi:hypothetical protein